MTLKKLSDPNNCTETDEIPTERSDAYLKEIGKAIHSSVEKLRVLSGTTESDFLKIGKRLQEFLYSSRQLSEDSTQISGTIAEDILKKSIGELTVLLEQFSGYLTNSSNDIKSDGDELILIIGQVTTITETFSNFKSIVGQMRMLGIATKIESARLGNQDEGFTVIAENVEKLSNYINDKTALIVHKANSLLSEIDHSKQQLEKLEKEQQTQAGIILHNTSMAVSDFDGKYRSATADTAKIAEEADDVQKNISAIITALQFHDISRQKLEHIVDALDNLPMLKDDDPDGLQEISGTYFDVCSLQLSHLSQVGEEFQHAIFQIIEHMRNLGQDVENVFQDVTRILGIEALFGQNSLSEIKKEFIAIMDGMKKNAEIGSAVSGSIKSIVTIIDELSNQVIEIESVGTEIEIIALNAIVKSAHTGKNGAALGVLAQSIQKLSLETKERTRAASEVLESTGKISERLKQRMDEDINREKGDSAAVINMRIADILDPIDALRAQSGVLLGKLRTRANILQHEIESEIHSITVHEQVKQVLSEVMTSMEESLQELMKDGYIESNREMNTGRLYQRYTMHSERKIHQQFMDHGKQKSLPTNLIKNRNPETQFGENVELF